MWKLTTSAYRRMDNGATERANHIMAQLLSMLVNERKIVWDERLPHVQSVFNNSVNNATVLAPNELHSGRLPRLPLTVMGPRGERSSEPLSLSARELPPCAKAPVACLPAGA